jgi:hyperosmotically inducible protein
MDMNRFNRNLLNLTMSTLLSTLAAGVAVAGATPKAAPPSFKDYDSNGDGKVSPDEFRARGGDEQAFREADANRDDRLDSDEFIKAVANDDRSRAGKVVDDAWITAKVKALLLNDEAIKGAEVEVQTHQGLVLLSGQVDRASQIARAENLARGVEGVKMVSNDLRVRR